MPLDYKEWERIKAGQDYQQMSESDRFSVKRNWAKLRLQNDDDFKGLPGTDQDEVLNRAVQFGGDISIPSPDVASMQKTSLSDKSYEFLREIWSSHSTDIGTMVGLAIIIAGIFVIQKKYRPSIMPPSKAEKHFSGDTMKNQGSPPKAFSWKSVIIAILIAFIITSIGAAATNTKPRTPMGMYWTSMWIFLTIESWKYWKWKSLLPYLAYFLCVFLATATATEAGWEILNVLIVKGALNVGGITIFAIIYFLRFKKEVSENQKEIRVQPHKYRDETSSELNVQPLSEIQQPTGFIDSNNSFSPMLIKCPACGKNFSKRAPACPQCGSVQIKECQVCKSKISIHNTECPDCGDPFPFNNITAKKIGGESQNKYPNDINEKQQLQKITDEYLDARESLSKGKSERVEDRSWKCPKCDSSNPNSIYKCNCCGYDLIT